MFDLPLGRRMHIYKQKSLSCMLGRDMKCNAHSMLRKRCQSACLPAVLSPERQQNMSLCCAYALVRLGHTSRFCGRQTTNTAGNVWRSANYPLVASTNIQMPWSSSKKYVVVSRLTCRNADSILLSLVWQPCLLGPPQRPFTIPIRKPGHVQTSDVNATCTTLFVQMSVNAQPVTHAYECFRGLHEHQPLTFYPGNQGRFHSSVVNLKINRRHSQQVLDVKYLGLVLDSHLKLEQHGKMVSKAVRASLHTFIRDSPRFHAANQSFQV